MAKRAPLMTTDSINSVPYFPDDMVFQILIRLPVESLLRFKTVCKNWRTMIEQEDFVLSHSECAPIVPFIPDGKHTVAEYYRGNVLEQNLRSKKFRVRNPGLRLVLDLPDPSNVSSIMTFVHDGEFYKLISFYDNDGQKGFEVLTFITEDLSWKTVPAPTEFFNKSRKVFRGRRDYCDAVVRYFWIDTSDESGRNFKIGVESFDVKSERFGTSSSMHPPDFFRKFHKVDAICYLDRLAVYAIEPEKMKLHVSLLSDRTQEWIERKTFDMNFLESFPTMREWTLSLVDVTEDEFIFHVDGDGELRVDYSMELNQFSGFREDAKMLRRLQVFCVSHTLVAYRGMQPETKI